METTEILIRGVRPLSAPEKRGRGWYQRVQYITAEDHIEEVERGPYDRKRDTAKATDIGSNLEPVYAVYRGGRFVGTKKVYRVGA